MADAGAASLLHATAAASSASTSAAAARHKNHHHRHQLQPQPAQLLHRRSKPRQEISACLKWLTFVLNFCAFLVSLTVLSLGVYLCVKDPRGVSEWTDVVLNPAIMLALIGFLSCVISMIGAIGALRDNIQLLKTFAISVFACYILAVAITFLLFILFYAETPDGISATSVLFYGIRRYHTNRNIADLIDYLQEQLECCGVSSMSAGFRDWNMSPQFNCSDANPYPERCGVPFSCCRRSVVSEAAGSANPLLPAMRSLECWQNALSKRPQDLEVDIHLRGCLFPLRTLFETHALHIGIVVAVFIIPVCVLVCLANILARQIDHQRWLLKREALRIDRRRKRDRYRLEQQRAASQPPSAVPPTTRKKTSVVATAPPLDSAGPPKLPDTPPPDKPPAEYSAAARRKRVQQTLTAAADFPVATRADFSSPQQLPHKKSSTTMPAVPASTAAAARPPPHPPAKPHKKHG